MDLQQQAEAAKELLGTFGEYRDAVSANAKEIGKQVNQLNEVRSLYGQLDTQLKKLQNSEEGISRLNDKQLSDIQKKAKEQVEEIKRQAESFKEKIQAQNESLLLDKNGKELNSSQLKLRLRSLVAARELTDEQANLLQISSDKFAIEEETLNAINAEVERREDVNKSLGVAGNLLKGIEGIGSNFAKAFGLDKVAKDMEDFADKAADGTKRASQLQVLGKGLQSAFRELGTTLRDPSVVIGYIVKTFGEFEKSNREVRQLTGQTAASLSQTANSYSSFNMSATSAVDQVKTIGSLSKEIGININAAFSPNTVLAATELTELMGVSAQSTANLAMNAEAFGKDLGNVDELAENTVKSFALQGKGALNMQQVLENAGGASQSLQLSFKGNNEELLKASANAAALGLTLGDVEKIADSLLDFESSIASELEAELITGKNLNLEKARTAALNNDMATLTKEIANNQEILSAFSSGNRIQQDAVAKSLGMSKDQVAKMIVLQKISDGMTAEQAAKAADINVEEAKRLSATDSITKSLDKMAAAFAPILDIVSKVVSSKVGMGALMILVTGLVASKGFIALTKGFKGIRDDLKEALDIYKSLFEKGKEFFGGGEDGGGIGEKLTEKAQEKGDELVDKALGGGTDVAGDAAESAENISENSGSKIKKFLEDLGGGLKAMAGGKVLQGALNLIPTSIGFIAMVPAIPSLLFFGLTPLKQLLPNLENLGLGLDAMSGGKVLQGVLNLIPASLGFVVMVPAIPSLLFFGLTPLKQLLPNLEGLGDGLKAMAGGKVLQGALNLIPVALGFAVMTVGSIGLASIALLGNVAGIGLNGLSAGLIGFGEAMAVMTPLGPVGLVAPIALALLGASIIPFAYALKLATPGIEAFGTVVTAAFNGVATIIMTVGDVIIKMFETITDSIIKLSEPQSLKGLITLIGLAPGLGLLAISLMGVAASLTAIGVAGILALPTIAALTGLGVVAGTIATGGGETQNEVVQELKEVKEILTQILNKDSSISLDSTRLGTAMSISSAKIQ